MNRILIIDPDINFANARQIVDTRNWVIYGFEKVDDIVLWATISNHLPNLKKEIEDYLEAE